MSLPETRIERQSAKGPLLGFFSSQLLSISSNAAFGFVLARSVTLSDLGYFSVPYGAFVFTIGVARSGLGEALLYSWRVGGSQLLPNRRAVITAAAPMLLLMIGLTSLGSGFGPTRLAVPFAVFVCGATACVLQDVLRYCARCSNRHRAALCGDSVWLVVSVVIWAASPANIVPRQTVAVLGWSAGAIAGTLVLAFLLRTSMVAEWPERTMAQNRLFLDGLVNGVTSLVAPFTLLLFSSPAEAGKLRTVLFIMGPIVALNAGGSFALAPALARGSHARQVRSAWIFGACQSSATVLYGFTIALAPRTVEILVGVTNAQMVQGKLLFSALLWGVTSSVVSGFVVRSRMTARGLARILAFRYFALPLNLVGGAVSAQIGGAFGYLLLSSMVNMFLSFWLVPWFVANHKMEYES